MLVWIGKFLLSAVGAFSPGLAAAIGETIVRVKQTQVENDQVGADVAKSWLESSTDALRARADVRKAEGTWGPLGILTMVIGSFFAVHIGAVVLDSLPYLPRFTTVLWLLPWIELVPHSPCLCVAALPPEFQAVEIEAIRSLFLVGPPAGAAVVVARMFRRKG